MDVAFQCSCGQVTGRIADARPARAMRMTCYCTDCQAYLHHLGRADLFEPGAGSDISQFAPAAVTITAGHNKIAATRLSGKGLFRWHTTCCNTPLANTVGPRVPHLGMLTSVAAGSHGRDEIAGKTSGTFRSECAAPGAIPQPKRMLSMLAKAFGKIASWRLGGLGWPHPFFDRATRQPAYPVHILSPQQRDALRPLCGPAARS